ncbi:MAG: molybdate ABC transporter substrate-binding protein, partial [Gammaproteobacteria bacterium]|nr:molybdate ABC transporter substrate-binding protein [Gammaproteobacteria bacterium]
MLNRFYRIIQSRKTIANRSSVAVLVCSLVFSSTGAYTETPIVAVASNLSTPMTEIAEAFRSETGKSIRLSFGSSGNLSRQVVQGAPYDIFISASEAYIDFITAENVIIKHQFKFIEGEIGFYIPQGSLFANLQTIEEIINALKFGRQGRVAIANP